MDKIVLGKVVKLHGFLGGFKVATKYDKDFDIKKIEKVFDENGNEFKVNRVFQVKDGLVFMLDCVDGEKAKTFINKNIFVLRSLVAGKILIEDLKGSKVYFENQKFVGEITDVQDFGSAEVFYLKTEKNSEILFPNVNGVIVNFDLENKILIVNEKRFIEVSDEN